MTDKRLVLTTTGSKEEAHKIARALVEGQLAACVNIVPGVESVYRWEEKVEEAREWLLLIKTTERAVERVGEVIQELHSYDLPERASIAIDGGGARYLQWIGESVET